jgi:hypothetical protein
MNGAWPTLNKNSAEDMRRLRKLIDDGYEGHADERYVADAVSGGWTEEQAVDLAKAARRQKALDELKAGA